MTNVDIEIDKLNLLEKRGTKPTSEQIEMARQYVMHLDSLKIKPQKPPSEDLIVEGAFMWCRMVYNYGGGDPIKAAEKHAKAVEYMNKQKWLTTSDESKVVH